MINSCGTGKPTEADGERESGSGRKRRQLFGLFGCSSSGGSPPPKGALASGAKPHPKEAALLLCCCVVVFLWARPSAVPAVA